jgi:hypothetical protein
MDYRNETDIIQAVIAAARTGDIANASSLLNTAIRHIQAGLSKGKIGVEGISKISYSLETLLMMQKQGDWVAFADVLEYEFLPLWNRVNDRE